MRPKPLAGDNVFQTVAIDIDDSERVTLRELHAITIGRGIFVKNEVFAKADLAVLPDLLKPGQAILMRCQAGDDVLQSVAVYIVNNHLRSARAKGKWMVQPSGITPQRRWLLPPAILLQDIDASIAIDIAATKAVSKALPFSFGCDRMKRPGRFRMFPIRRGVADVASRATEDLWLAIAVDVGESWRFVIEHVENDMPLPVSLAALRVFIPGHFLAGKAVD